MPKVTDLRGKIHRQNQVKRMLSLTNVETALSVSEIAERLVKQGFDTTRKTVERDIQDISLAYPLMEEGTNPRRFYFDGEFKLDFQLTFDENQLQTIVLALESLKQLSPKVIKNLCREVEDTLVSKLPKALAKEFEHLKSISHSAPTVLGEGDELEPEVLEIILDSLRKARMFQCLYHSPDESRSSDRLRTFAPLRLHFVGAPYLYVYDHEDQVIKLLRISRISKPIKTQIPVDTKRGAEIKMDYVFGGYGKGSEKIIDYSITCSKPMALKFKEHKIHPSQKIEVLKAGVFCITFSVHDSSEITRLLAQYGEFIQNIEPASEYEKVKAIWKKGLGAA